MAVSWSMGHHSAPDIIGFLPEMAMPARDSAAQSALETALTTFEDSLDNRRALLTTLLQSKVYVVLDMPWDGRSLPSTSAHMLFVSDGENTQQAMLAVFTGQPQAAAFPVADSAFKHPVEVDMLWALLGLPKEAGIMLNPNAGPSFRITPDLGAQLRSLAEQQLAARMAKAGVVEPR